MLVNFLKNWKCAAVLKPDGAQSAQDTGTISTNFSVTNQTTTGLTTKYYKRGTISHPNQVPWH